MSNPGLWIVIEGIDGAGKTSAIQTIQHVFLDHGLSVKVLREPGGTKLGEKLREILKSPELNVLGHAEVLLLYAARLQLLEEIIFPSLKAGIHVILDRHELSTFAYQGGGRGVDLNFIQHISQISMPEKKPNLTLFLSIDPNIAHERIVQRGELDHIEQQSITFFQKVALSYEQLICEYPNIICIDANQDFEQVQQDIREIIINFLENYLT
jgi:dTMP kinase